jgi:hypothetical protein
VHDPLILNSREYPGDYKFNSETLMDNRLEVEKGLWNKERLTREIEPVLRFRDTFGLQVSCDEFGVYHQAPRESQLRWISDFISILKEYGIGYSYWNYKNLDFGLISIGEKMHQDLPQFNNEKRLDQEMLKLLSSSSSAF